MTDTAAPQPTHTRAEIVKLSRKHGQRRCPELIESSASRCVRAVHLFGPCVDEWGFSGRLRIDKKEARRLRAELARNRAWFAHTFPTLRGRD